MTIKLSITGDIFLSDQPHMVGIGVRSCTKKTKIRDYPFHKVKNHLKRSDIVFGNLESSFSNKRNKFILKPFLIDIKSAISLKNANYNILNVANNHIMENGLEGFIFTKNVLKNLNIKIVGQNDNSDKYFTKPLILIKKNKKFLFLGYSLKAEEIDKNILYSLANEEMIIEDMKKIKKEEDPDIIIVSLHWGDEYISIPHPENVKLGRKLIDEGANLIIGHHSHVIAPIEKYKNSFIIYSLGNFVFDMSYPLTNYGLLIDIIIPNKDNEYILKPHIIEIQENWIPKIIKLDFKKLIFTSRKIDNITKNIVQYYNILSINRKNYRKSFYMLLIRNLLKNPYYIIPFLLRMIKVRRLNLIKKMKCF